VVGTFASLLLSEHDTQNATAASKPRPGVSSGEQASLVFALEDRGDFLVRFLASVVMLLVDQRMGGCSRICCNAPVTTSFVPSWRASRLVRLACFGPLQLVFESEAQAVPQQRKDGGFLCCQGGEIFPKLFFHLPLRLQQ
jgi:hypothetical protein